MEQYGELILLGVAIAIILVIGIVLRVMGIRYKALPGEKKHGKGKRRKKSRKGTGDEVFFQEDPYEGDGAGEGEVFKDDPYEGDGVGDGDSNEVWEDYDMYSLKKDKGKKKGKSKGKKDDGKYESWDDY